MNFNGLFFVFLINFTKFVYCLHTTVYSNKADFVPRIINSDENAVKAEYLDLDTRIKGGIRANIEEYPSMGAIGWLAKGGTEKWKFMCGGTLIHPVFVLTAAHCSLASSGTKTVSDTKPQIVRFGTSDLKESVNENSRVDAMIKEFVSHEMYQSPVKYYDIAIIWLDKEVAYNMNTIRPACLKQVDVSEGTDVSIAGWGKELETGEGSNYLLAGKVTVIEKGKCGDLWIDFFNRNLPDLRGDQLCAASADGSIDTCGGDSGGPLLEQTEGHPECLHYVVGVTSFGLPCSNSINPPSIYTKMSYFYQWVEEKMHLIDPRFNRP